MNTMISMSDLVSWRFYQKAVSIKQCIKQTSQRGTRTHALQAKSMHLFTCQHAAIQKNIVIQAFMSFRFRRLLRKAMKYWKKYIPLLREEKKREKRRNDLRKHVSSLLPDFQALHVHHSP